ncbi:MAG: alpha/beta fold hydrolase [Lautropia sp.]|nr:alpha/beta fold hydrolase [Lautropia sp.]
MNDGYGGMVETMTARQPAQVGISRWCRTRHGQIHLKYWSANTNTNTNTDIGMGFGNCLSGEGVQLVTPDAGAYGRNVDAVGASANTEPVAETRDVWGAPSRTRTAVLLHGMFGSIDVWSATALNLSRAGLNVLAIDLPGHGDSRAQVRSVDAVVEAVADVLVAEQPLHPVLVAHSFGSLIAARLLTQHLFAAEALVLLAPLGMGAEIRRRFIEGILSATDEASLAEALAYLTVRHYRASTSYLRAMLDRLDEGRPQLTALVRQLFDASGRVRYRILDCLQAFEGPQRIVQGRADAVLPWRHVLDAPPQTALHLLPDTGHMPHWEANALTIRLILQTIHSIE